MELTDKIYKRFILCAFSGLFTSLIMAIPQIGVFEWLSLIPAALVLYIACSEKKANYFEIFGHGVFFFLPFYLVVTNWFLYMYPLDFIYGMSPATALMIVLLAWIGVSVAQALAGGLIFMLIAFLFRTAPLKRLPLLRPLAAACVWVVYEWVQTWDWWGMPNCRLANGQTKILLGIQTASLLGSYLVTFILVAVNFWFAYAVMAMRSDEDEKKGRKIKLSSLLAAIMLVFNYGTGAVLWLVNSPNKSNESVKVAAIQANIPMSGVSNLERRNAYREHTLAAAADGAEVVVWAETAFPSNVENENVREFISELAQEANVMILAGVFTYDEEDRTYNSLVCFTPDGEMHETVYRKRHLVPFGEFVPLKSFINTFIPALADLATLGSDMTPGKGTNVIKTDKGNIGASICYDAVYEDITLDGVGDGAEYFCISSNDAWFDDSVFLTFHNSQASLRSVEVGRYSVHSANTGISTVIDHRGEIHSELSPLTEGRVSGNVELRNNRTLYSYVGNILVYASVAAVAILIVWQLVYAIVKRKKA